MKIIYFLMYLFLCSSFIFGQSYNIMTYNLRYENPNDGENSWSNRKEFILSQIEYYEPDIFGTQEGKENQLSWLDENLGMYSFIGIGRDENRNGEHSAIFYNSRKLEVISSNTFWLSETPEIVSKGWDANQNRICTYALFSNICDGSRFYVFNVHFDHKGKIAQAKSAELIIKQIENINKDNYPLFLMGDFNLTPEESPILEIRKKLNDSRAISISKPFGPDETFCGFDTCQPNVFRIDYIFTSRENITVNKYAVLANIKNMKYPSDHFPVMINIELKK